jgi:hypothetical protein
MMKLSSNVRLVFALLLLSAACAAARGQQQAYKIEETTYTRCDLSEVPQLTEESLPFSVELDKHPEAKVALVVYANQPGEALSYARHVKLWLTKSGVTAERLLEVYGGFAQEKRLELWLVPVGAEPPPAAPAFARAGVTLFDEYNYWGGDSCSYEREVALEVFAETLKRMPGWRATLVVRPHLNRRGLKFNEAGWDDAALNRRQALRQAAADRLHLVRQLGLDPARIRAVVGARSVSDWSHAELWLIPPPAPASRGR